MRYGKEKNKLLVISLVVNLVFISGVAFVGYLKRESIVSHVLAVIKDDVSEETLSTFNREPYKSANGIIDNGYRRTLSVMFLGNSLTITGVPEEENDKEHDRGLASTQIDNDYVHVLLQMISKKKAVNIKYTTMNIADFERNLSRVSFDRSQLANVLVKEPDYVIFQIGENVSRKDVSENGANFERRYSEMIAGFNSSIKIVCLPFWPEKDKNIHITNVAVTNGAYLVDLSHLGSGIDPQNFALSSKKYRQLGVGEHPGDYGMKNIAENLFTIFNATLKE